MWLPMPRATGRRGIDGDSDEGMEAMNRFDGLSATVRLGHDDVEQAEFRMIPASGGDVAFPVVWIGGLTLVGDLDHDLAEVLRRLADGVDRVMAAEVAAA